MKMHRPAIYLLPVIFAGILFFAKPSLEFMLLDYGVGARAGDIRITSIIIIINSFILQFWLLALASGQPAYKPWKAILALNLGVILPGSLTFLFCFVVFSYIPGIGEAFTYAPIFGTVITLLLCWGCYRLLLSRLFSPYLEKGFTAPHIYLLIITGFTMFLHNALIFFSLIAAL